MSWRRPGHGESAIHPTPSPSCLLDEDGWAFDELQWGFVAPGVRTTPFAGSPPHRSRSARRRRRGSRGWAGAVAACRPPPPPALRAREVSRGLARGVLARPASRPTAAPRPPSASRFPGATSRCSRPPRTARGWGVMKWAKRCAISSRPCPWNLVAGVSARGRRFRSATPRGRLPPNRG